MTEIYSFTDYSFTKDEVNKEKNAKSIKIEYTETIEDEISILTMSVE